MKYKDQIIEKVCELQVNYLFLCDSLGEDPDIHFMPVGSVMHSIRMDKILSETEDAFHGLFGEDYDEYQWQIMEMMVEKILNSAECKKRLHDIREEYYDEKQKRKDPDKYYGVKKKE